MTAMPSNQREPRLIRRLRPSQDAALFLPLCRHCAKTLRGRQTSWCSRKCAQQGNYWVWELRHYWEKAG